MAKTNRLIQQNFFNCDAMILASRLLGKVLRVRYKKHWLAAMIIETEAYYMDEKASHASLGFTQKRKALFMPPGTIYMYYARGGDSLNVSAKGKGNAVLIKAGIPYNFDEDSGNIKVMQALNPINGKPRPVARLCSGQTLLCRSLNLKVPDWNQKDFNEDFQLWDIRYTPDDIIQTTRLGIPKGRDEHLLYRLIDKKYVKSATKNPLTLRQSVPMLIINQLNASASSF